MSYRALATRPVLVLAGVSVTARLPVATAPLAVVLLVRERPGGYSMGAALAAVYVIGEVLGAFLLGPRLKAHRARPALAVGLAVGALSFAGLGVCAQAHPVVLGALAALAGAAPGAVPGGLRALLTSLVEEAAVAQAFSADAMLNYAVWAASPAIATGLALGVDPVVPMYLAAGLMAVAVAALWGLPAGWPADEKDREGVSMARTLASAWPLYVTGAAGLSLLALAELVLPALLEQRGVAVGWAGPVLAGYSLAAAVGAYVYGLRSWPGSPERQSLVMLVTVALVVGASALVPVLGWIAAGLVVAGLLQSVVQIARALSLRNALPRSAFAAGYSMMYASVGAGYAASAVLAGAVQSVAAPSTAILAGAGLCLLLTLVAAVGERRRSGSASGPGSVGGAGAGAGAGSGVGVGEVGAEGAAVDRGRDAECGL
ncbi:MFS transporter [Streptomyces sp. NPDC051561]|uniref:MFS transporter n=1 Tax=Streptomyces sp. NPDC051561 TaxID=3365658 RepID=UPI00379EC470